MAHSPLFQDMVAYLYPGGRPLSAKQATGDMRLTTVKLVPRQGMTAAWRDQLMDACHVHGCARLLDEAEPPSFDMVLAQTPTTCDLQVTRHLHQLAVDEWRMRRGRREWVCARHVQVREACGELTCELASLADRASWRSF